MVVKLQAAKDIRAAIKVIAKKGPELDKLVHDTVIQCMAHAKEHGDVTLLGELVGGCTMKDGKVTQNFEAGALGSCGYGVGDLKSWIMGHTPIRFNNSTGAIGMPKGWQAEEKWKLDLAQENPFWSHPDYMARKVSRPPFSMDSIETIVQNLIGRIDRAVEDGKFEGDPEAAKAYVNEMLKAQRPEEDPAKVVHPKAENENQSEGAPSNKGADEQKAA